MNLLNFTTATAKKAGKLILKMSVKGFKSQLKGPKDLVTEVDIASENLIIKAIKSAYPTHEILAEEDTSKNGNHIEKLLKAPYIWIIDPIDGTVNFSRGLPYYAVSIALFKKRTSSHSKNFGYLDGEIILGVIYAPAIKELYTAEKGRGAYLNGKKIHVSKTTKISSAMFSTGFPRNQYKDNLPHFTKMMEKSRAIRRFGAATLDFMNVAKGCFDGYWELNLYPWDMAAGALIVKEAGGRVTDINGNLLDLFGKNFLATNKKLHAETVQILGQS